MKLNKTFYLTLGLLILLAGTTSAGNFGIGLRGGYYMSPNWADTYDVVYDNGGEITYGFELNYLFTPRFEVGVAVDLISGDGERVWADETGGWVPAGESVTFDIMPITAFGRFYLMPESTLSPFIGAGVGFASFEETDEDSESGMGFLVLGGLKVEATQHLSFLGEAEYSTYPEIIGEGDLSEFFNEDDIGGITIRFALVYRF